MFARFEGSRLGWIFLNGSNHFAAPEVPFPPGRIPASDKSKHLDRCFVYPVANYRADTGSSLEFFSFRTRVARTL
jgi:hypothetical protein